ncbi:MAG: hypothetical protein ACXADO_05895, partial [Candidatus Thorarchaeota archaeon]
LLRITNHTLQELVSCFRGSGASETSILCIEGGSRTTIDDLGTGLPADTSIPVTIGVGAYPHGDLKQGIKDEFKTHIELDKDTMMAWHVCAEVIWTYSWRVSVVKSRYENEPAQD